MVPARRLACHARLPGNIELSHASGMLGGNIRQANDCGWRQAMLDWLEELLEQRELELDETPVEDAEEM